MKSFKVANKRMGFDKADFWHFQTDLIRSNENSAQIQFKGLDDEENIKGIEDVDIIYNNEWNQFTEDQWAQQRKRLRGRPNQKFICDWNPISSLLWIYKDWIDLDEWTDLPLDMPDAPTKYSALNAEHSFKRINKAGNSVWIKITHRDNYWIVGHPSGKGGFIDYNTLADFEWDRINKPNMYRIYANGDRGIMRTGGEFWKQFDNDKHVKPVAYQRAPIHVTIDENGKPYVTLAIWQVIGGNINQIAELPCKTPENNAPKAARKFISYLQRIDHQDMVFVYGDPSSKRGSTVDENNKSFYDKFFEELTAAKIRYTSRVGKGAPEVALSAAFINEIYEFNLYGWVITVDSDCAVSIEDYLIVKEAPDGTMIKPTAEDPVTKKKYETHGHFSDAKRYFIIQLLKNDWDKWRKTKTKLAPGHFR